MSDSHHAAALAVIKAILTVADAEGMPDDMVIPIWPKADPQDPAPFTDHPPLTVGGVRALADMAAQRDALAAFKAFVHRRLDEAGVPTHPDGPHSKEGCRIGDRLDIVLNERQPLPDAIMQGLRWIAEDNALPINPGLAIPGEWAGLFSLAHKEAASLSPDELQMAIEGGDGDGGDLPHAIAIKAGAFTFLMELIFDGALHEWAYGEGIAYPTPPPGYQIAAGLIADEGGS